MENLFSSSLRFQLWSSVKSFEGKPTLAESEKSRSSQQKTNLQKSVSKNTWKRDRKRKKYLANLCASGLGDRNLLSCLHNSSVRSFFSKIFDVKVKSAKQHSTRRDKNKHLSYLLASSRIFFSFLLSSTNFGQWESLEETIEILSPSQVKQKGKSDVRHIDWGGART